MCNNDVFYAELDEVVAVLKTSKIEKTRGYIRYVFPHRVDVFETLFLLIYQKCNLHYNLLNI